MACTDDGIRVGTELEPVSGLGAPVILVELAVSSGFDAWASLAVSYLGVLIALLAQVLSGSMPRPSLSVCGEEEVPQ